jgi:hypothetical protein
MAETKDELSPWDRIIGPFYTVESAARLLKLSEAELLRKADKLEVLRVITSDEVTLFPAFQFADEQVIQGIPETLAILKTGTDASWTWALWLNAKVGFEDEVKESAVDKLLSDRKDEVLLEATHDAWAWSQ